MTTTTLTPLPPAPAPAAAAPAAPAARASALPYHRLALANPAHRWWKPLVTLAATALVYAAMFLLLVVVGAVVGLASPDTWDSLDAVLLDMNHPTGVLLGFGSVALLLPATALGIRLAERRTLGTLGSVAGRLRWNRLGPALGLAAILYALILGVDLAVAAASGPIAPSVGAATWPIVAVALLVVPFQCAAEEYVFRALPQQALGAWLKSPWWGILLPIPFFVVGHGYDPLGQASVGLFALVAGILVWRTGGLEYAIGLHVINNVSGTLLVAVGLADGNATATTLTSVLILAGAEIVFTVLALRHHASVTARERAIGALAA